MSGLLVVERPPARCFVVVVSLLSLLQGGFAAAQTIDARVVAGPAHIKPLVP